MSNAQQTGHVRRSRATLTKQACDACKTRKVKCTYDESVAPTATAHRPCRRCTRLAIDCTFTVPQKCRGPRRRRTDVSNTASTTTPGETSRPPDDDFLSTDLGQSSLSTSSHLQNVSGRTATQEVNSLSRPVQSRNLSYLLNSEVVSPTAAHLPTTPASLDHASNYGPTTTPLAQRTYQTDSICSRELFKRIIGDYLELVYPVVPVVHRPTFRQDLERERDAYDTDFFLLLVGICALTLGIGSSRFERYQRLDPTLPFQSAEAMINHCYDLFVCHRQASYYDQVSHQKWAVSYCLVTAFFQIGHHNRSRMLEIEAMQLARLLELHRASTYEGLDFVEAQLRKKAFWLIFYSLVHNKLQFARRERLLYLDCAMLRTIDFQALLPAEIEDEYITPDTMLPRPNTEQANIVTAFNMHSKLFCTALMPLWRVSNSGSVDLSRADSDRCCGCECIEIKLQVQSLEDRFEELRFMLDKCPPRLQPWAPSCDSATHDSVNSRVSNLQMEIVRANIHITHLWLQCMVLDRLDALHSNNSNLPPQDLSEVWTRREDIARQMLHVLHSFSDEPLEPNGYHTFCKIRDVAVSLLNCPYEEGNRVTIRANEYLHRFTEILWRLDKSELLNSLSLQNWIDTGRQE
ncbi:hypothetical protein D6C86_07619 [Aureobasidium pullulans]|nr:hypothetical protein D6D27_00957 [Aureobasidium pullulans]THZ56746.1 hypothetical protein D6C86_07619 [Aureobasidium pullulans]